MANHFFTSSHTGPSPEGPSSRSAELVVDPLFDRYDLVFVIRKYWLLLVSLPILCAVVGAIAFSLRQPVYESSSLLLIDSSLDQLIQFEQVGSSSGLPAVQASLKSLEVALVADSVVLRVVERMGLREAEGFLPAEWSKEPNVPDSKLLDFLRKHRFKATLQPETRLIQISVFDPDPERAREIAMVFLEEFESFLADQRKKEVQTYQEVVQAQVAEARLSALEAEDVLGRFREAHSEIPLEQDNTLFSARMTQFGEDLNAAVRNRVELESIRASLEDLAPDTSPIEIIEIGGYRGASDVSALLTALSASRSRLSAAREQYTENHPTLLAANAEVERNVELLRETAAEIVSSIETRYEAARKREEFLTAKMAELQEQLVAVKAASSEFRALKEDAENRWLLHQSLQKRLSDSIMATQMPGNIATVISEPLVPFSPAGPPLMLYLAIGGFFGCILSAGWLACALLAGVPFSHSRQIEERLGLSVLADWSRNASGRPGQNESSAMTQYLDGASSRFIQVSAPGLNGMGESVANRIAHATVRAGQRTLLLLVKAGPVNQEIMQTPVPGIDRLEVSPGSILNEARFATAIERLKEDYGKIVIETGAIDDPALVSWIARFADRNVVAIGRGTQAKARLAERVFQLNRAGAAAIAAVFVEAKSSPIRPRKERGLARFFTPSSVTRFRTDAA